MRGNRKTIKRLKISEQKRRRIFNLLSQLAAQRGRESAQKVFQVLGMWLEDGLILDWEEYRKWGYQDYIQHYDGWFMTTQAEMIVFQIVSSVNNAREHLAKYPDIPVIVVDAGITAEALSEKMKELFREQLLQAVDIII